MVDRLSRSKVERMWDMANPAQVASYGRELMRYALKADEALERLSHYAGDGEVYIPDGFKVRVSSKDAWYAAEISTYQPPDAGFFRRSDPWNATPAWQFLDDEPHDEGEFLADYMAFDAEANGWGMGVTFRQRTAIGGYRELRIGQNTSLALFDINFVPDPARTPSVLPSPEEL